MIKYARRTPDELKSAIRQDAMRLLGFNPPDNLHGLVSSIALRTCGCANLCLASEIQHPGDH